MPVSRGLNPIFHFRYCGTTMDLMLKCSLCSQNGLLSLVDRFIGLGVFCLSSLAAKDLDAYHHCTCTKILPWLFLFFFCTFKIHTSFCQRTSAFYSWSNILFILLDLYPFRYLVITLPCFKKEKEKKSLLKEKNKAVVIS